MKKTLVALAALAATASFAQSSVTLSGNLDFAGFNSTGSQLIQRGTTFATTTGTASTSVINIRAVEDLGAGMKVTAHYGLDPRSLANDSYAVTNNASSSVTNAVAATGSPLAGGSAGTAAAQANTATGLARDEVFVGIEGSFGNIRLGSPNSIGLNGFQVASPLGTGVGSGYAPVAGAMTNSYVNTRYNRSVRYDSPVMNGFTFAALYAPGNDQAQVNTASVVGTSGASAGVASTALPVALLIQDARATTEIGLRYANGPLTVMFTNISQAANDNKTGWYVATGTAAAKSTSMSTLDASYNMGATTLYAGMNQGQRLAVQSATSGAAVDSKGYRVAVKQDVGAISLIAQYSVQTSLTPVSGAALGTEIDSRVTGLRADYNLSKTAVAYVGLERWDTGIDYAAALPTSSGDRTLVSVGLRKSF